MPREKITIGHYWADKITRIVGSWSFLIVQSIVLFFWIVVNVTAWVQQWDPYPFILLNLALSFQAAYAAPVILMSQNRMAEKDRTKAQLDLTTDRKAEREILDVIKKLNSLERNKIDRIIALLEENKK